jgi:hypothetical protein
MAKRTRYELGYNWPDTRDHAFTTTLERAARRRRIRCLRVTKGQEERIRRRVDDGRIEVGLFLNTQADATRMESPSMLLCRSLKSRGCLVVEDPDDAHVYADRELQLTYLQRAGIPVPRRFAVEGWKPRKRALTRAERAKLGKTWVAQPAFGLDRNRRLISSAMVVSSALARAKFPRGKRVLVSSFPKPTTLDDVELNLSVWCLFGVIAPCWHRKGELKPVMIETQAVEHGCLPHLVSTTKRLSEITGLDWFVTQMVVTNRHGRSGLLVVEPPNALAGLGPGLRSTRDTPADVAAVAAERIVEVAWRHARGLPPTDGHELLFRSAGSRYD